MREIDKAVIDILTFALGMRPLLTADDLQAIVKWRLSLV
jgi:hypothetical protein